MPISDVVTVNISAAQPGVPRAGFGIPLILSATAAWPERTRTYTGIAGVGEDFATTSIEYLLASALFAQNPKPRSIMIGRLGNKPTQRRKITPTAVNGATYEVRVGENTAEYTADGSATVAEITAGLTSAINALTGDTCTAADVTTHLTVTGNTAGDWDDVEVMDVNLLSIEQDHADPGVATDLAAILLESGAWYAIINPYNSKAMAVAIAGWAEANERLFLCDSQDTPIITSVVSGATDVAAAMQTAAYSKTTVWYHPSPGDALAAALGGRLLPTTPGSETWKFKTLRGVDPVVMTSTHRTNLLAKNANSYYEIVSGRNITFEGKVADGEWIDVIRGIDWLKSDIGSTVFDALATPDKVPFDDDGIAVVEGAVRASLTRGIKNKLLTADPAPVVEAPDVADVDPADKAARNLPDVTFSATLAGAIHATTITGSVSA